MSPCILQMNVACASINEVSNFNHASFRPVFFFSGRPSLLLGDAEFVTVVIFYELLRLSKYMQIIDSL